MKKNYFKVLLLLVLFIGNTSVNAQIIADGTYNIFNPTLSEVISVNRVAEGDPGNPQNVIIGRARMQVYDASNSDQEWSFSHQGGDIYKISNVGDSSILGVKDGWCGDFGDVQVGFDNSSPYTLFKVIAGTNANSFVFQIAFDSDCNFGSTNVPIKAFDIDGGNSGSKINTFPTDSGNANQEFEIVALGTLSTNNSFLSDALSVYYDKDRGLVINSKNADLGKLSISVFDLSGRAIISKESNGNRTTMKLETLNKGVFFARISNKENNTLVKKFIVF
ncbi:T9SS type A sorting domain-containing protein [Hyunsoonleella flava]|uniref:T9SS type A sorting domain-containing protein n=1 Tax=Hyunsoonleella flava TaxID=2527939 RepID=A0A4Q9FJ18_9FLAO|nr:T9SS type A sorting domain-containing protein [Hyunsoonleella flava]TBN03687.1 T9SS type A sorting domain-containing protein [Hyunsoonleella flava]